MDAGRMCIDNVGVCGIRYTKPAYSVELSGKKYVEYIFKFFINFN